MRKKLYNPMALINSFDLWKVAEYMLKTESEFQREKPCSRILFIGIDQSVAGNIVAALQEILPPNVAGPLIVYEPGGISIVKDHIMMREIKIQEKDYTPDKQDVEYAHFWKIYINDASTYEIYNIIVDTSGLLRVPSNHRKIPYLQTYIPESRITRVANAEYDQRHWHMRFILPGQFQNFELTDELPRCDKCDATTWLTINKACEDCQYSSNPEDIVLYNRAMYETWIRTLPNQREMNTTRRVTYLIAENNNLLIDKKVWLLGSRVIDIISQASHLGEIRHIYLY